MNVTGVQTCALPICFGWNEGFVALDVQNHIHARILGASQYLGDSLRPGTMVPAGHDGVEPRLVCNPDNAKVVGRHDHLATETQAGHTARDSTDERHAGDMSKGFFW